MVSKGRPGPTGPQGPIGSTSDKRLKNDIRSIETPLSKVLSLRGVEYIWRKEGINGEIIEEGGSKDIGVIAQEVKEILPELIGGTEKHGYKVSYDEMISVLFEAIKEQELILDVKESELTELENKFKRNQ